MSNHDKHYIQLEPTIQTEIVTTTKKTIINYPEIQIQGLDSSTQQQQLNAKEFPLSNSEIPEHVANFDFSLPNGHLASYHSYDLKGKKRAIDCPPKKKLREDDSGNVAVGSSGSVRSPLPSPVASPSRMETTTEWDDSVSNNANNSNTLPVLLSFPHLLNVYPTLSTATQSHILLNLLRLSDISSIRNVNDFIKPALQKDFIGQLPLEISSLILNFLDIRDLARSASVSKTWKKIVDHDRAAWKAAGIRADLWFGDEEHLANKRQEVYLSANRTRHKERLNMEKESDTEMDGTRTPLTPPPMSNINSSSESPKKLTNTWKYHPYKHILKKRHTIRQNWFNNEPKAAYEFERHGQNVVTCLQFDSDKIVTASDGDDKSIDVSCTKTGRLRRRLRGHTGGVWALQYIGDTLVSGATDRTVRVWDIPSGRCTHVLSGHYSTVRCLTIIMPKYNNLTKEYEPPYPIIVSGSRDFTIRVWRLPSPTRDQTWDLNDGDANTENNPWAMKLLSGHTNAVRSVAGEGKTLVSGSYDFTVRIWNTVTGDVEHVLRGHNDMVYKVVLDAPRNKCASGSYDGSVKVWSVDRGEQLQSLDGHSSLVGLLGLNSSSLISAGADSNLKIWDLMSGDCQHVLDGHDSAISCMAHDEQKIISGSDGMLKMWNAKDGKLKKDILSNLMHIWQVSMSDRYLVAASNKMSGQTFINVFDFGVVDEEDEEIEYSRLNWEPQWWVPVEKQ
ncbi:WD40 repeat-like protein [Wallemia mellicola]|nr:WD40 repeat-like protein [Wallemia mellicola]